MVRWAQARERERMEANRRLWDLWVDVHPRTAYYDLNGFRAGASTLRSPELGELGDVAGRAVLHLQCHFGLDTLSLARMGARVTGVDFSEPAVTLARSLAEEVGLEARFVQSDVYELTRVLHEQFDVVFTSYGALSWLPDIPEWGRVVARFLRPGGTFVIAENHPMAGCFREEDGRLDLSWSLFSAEPRELTTTRTYADLDRVHTPRPSYQWPWTVAGMASALIDAGLRVERLRELPLCSWRPFAQMTLDDEGWWRLPGDPLPLLVVCRAVKPL